MANEQNLMPIQEVNSRRSREQHRKDSRKGGKKSAEVRKQRKAMKEQMELLLALPFNAKDDEGRDIVDKLEFLGIKKKEIDNQMAMIISLWKTAIGDSAQKIQAVREIREIVQDNQIVNKENRIQIVNDLPEDDIDDN